MSTYILLLTLDTSGRDKALVDRDHLLAAEDEVEIPGVQSLGIYAVLGDYDFVAILEAPDNESAAQFSLELGGRAGAHITTLPAIPIGLLEREERTPMESEPTAAPEPELGSV